ncbi:MAG TPA: hypothetical protein VMS92_22900 [Mycobacterium sp.]|nr:hypothetical protein [Mycobacterium sp.]
MKVTRRQLFGMAAGAAVATVFPSPVAVAAPVAWKNLGSAGAFGDLRFPTGITAWLPENYDETAGVWRAVDVTSIED